MVSSNIKTEIENHFTFLQQNKNALVYMEGSKARIVQYEQEVRQ